MSSISSELQQFADLFNAQPGPVKVAFQYYLCLAMVEAGRMQLVEIVPGESGPYYIFETIIGDSFTFSVNQPPVDPVTEAHLVGQLREILDDKGE